MRIGTQSLRLTVVAACELPAHAQEPPFTPVTEAMLLDPDPADWINWRRTLDGWGFGRVHPVTH